MEKWIISKQKHGHEESHLRCIAGLSVKIKVQSKFYPIKKLSNIIRAIPDVISAADAVHEIDEHDHHVA